MKSATNELVSVVDGKKGSMCDIREITGVNRILVVKTSLFFRASCQETDGLVGNRRISMKDWSLVKEGSERCIEGCCHTRRTGARWRSK